MEENYCRTASFKGQITTVNDSSLDQELEMFYYESNISENVKTEVAEWLRSLNIFKRFDFDKILNEFFTGVALCKIVNRLRGKKAEIKIFMGGKLKKTEMKLNIRKALERLRKTQRFPAKSLFCEKELLENDFNWIWRLLIDLMNYYSGSRINIAEVTLSLNEMALQDKADSLLEYRIRHRLALNNQESMAEQLVFYDNIA